VPSLPLQLNPSDWLKDFLDDLDVRYGISWEFKGIHSLENDSFDTGSAILGTGSEGNWEKRL